MKIWGQHILVLTMLIFLSASRALAQDAGMSDVEMVEERDPSENEKSEGEKLVFTPGEDLRYIPKASVAVGRDSVALNIHDFPMQQATLKAPDKSTEKQSAKPKDDSILTFNFLYYIIQKYKLQDVID